MDERYYLSEKMTRYVLSTNGAADSGGWYKNSVLNPSVAHTITVRSVGGCQRCGVENYVVRGLPNDVPADVVRKLIYGD